jgi:ribosomal RNA assembly protein
MMYVRVPKERLGALIGPDGSVKRKIEERSGCPLMIDSKSGDVTVTDGEHPELQLNARNVVSAIGAGFSPEKAFKLFDNDYYYFAYDIRDFSGKDHKDIQRVRARIIGSEGRTRKLVEELAEVEVSVYDNTVAIIGDLMALDIARRAIELLLEGSEHAAVYHYLENKRKDLKFAKWGMS